MWSMRCNILDQALVYTDLHDKLTSVDSDTEQVCRIQVAAVPLTRIGQTKLTEDKRPQTSPPRILERWVGRQHRNADDVKWMWLAASVPSITRVVGECNA